MPKVAQRSWWWDHYNDHPSFGSGQAGSEGYAGAASSGKHKIYCKKCLDSHISIIVNEDNEAQMLGQREIVHDKNQIETNCTS
jgi:hypothetical protein